MAFDSHVDHLIGTVQIAPSPASSGDTLTLMPNDGDGFKPNMQVTIFPDSVVLPTRYNAEIAYITDVAGDVLKLNRRTEDSLPMQVKAGSKVVENLGSELASNSKGGHGLSAWDLRALVGRMLGTVLVHRFFTGLSGRTSRMSTTRRSGWRSG